MKTTASIQELSRQRVLAALPLTGFTYTIKDGDNVVLTNDEPEDTPITRRAKYWVKAWDHVNILRAMQPGDVREFPVLPVDEHTTLGRQRNVLNTVATHRLGWSEEDFVLSEVPEKDGSVWCIARLA